MSSARMRSSSEASGAQRLILISSLSVSKVVSFTLRAYTALHALDTTQCKFQSGPEFQQNLPSFRHRANAFEICHAMQREASDVLISPRGHRG